MKTWLIRFAHWLSPWRKEPLVIPAVRVEAIMAQLIAMKIAKIKPSDKWATISHYYQIKIAGDRTIEVRSNFGTFLNRGVIQERDVTVGMPGNKDGKGYRSVKILVGEQRAIIDASVALYRKSQERRTKIEEFESQDAALTIVEGLL